MGCLERVDALVPSACVQHHPSEASSGSRAVGMHGLNYLWVTNVYMLKSLTVSMSGTSGLIAARQRLLFVDRHGFLLSILARPWTFRPALWTRYRAYCDLTFAAAALM